MNMKRMICMLLALLMVFSMTACQSGSESPAATETAAAAETPTTEATEPATEATETIDEGYIFDVEASLAANSQTVTYKTPKEYETALHEMGFVEYRGDSYRITLTSGVACRPISLTYNDEVFRMDFNYLDLANMNDWNNLTAEVREVEGWSLYGLKNTDSIGNLSSFKIKDYDDADFMDYAETFPDLADELIQRVERMLCNLENGIPTDVVTIYEFYYLPTGNLYNIVRNHDDPILLPSMPHILCETKDEFDILEGYGFVEDANPKLEISQGDDIRSAEIRYIDKNGFRAPFYYEPGMTMAEWANSKYAVDFLWEVTSDGKMLLYDHQHPDDIMTQCCILNADLPIEDVLIYDSLGSYILAPLVTSTDNFVAVGSMAELEEYMSTNPNE